MSLTCFCSIVLLFCKVFIDDFKVESCIEELIGLDDALLDFIEVVTHFLSCDCEYNATARVGRVHYIPIAFVSLRIVLQDMNLLYGRVGEKLTGDLVSVLFEGLGLLAGLRS